MPRIDHVCIATRNIFEGAERLRDETGLDTYDSGWFPGMGIGQRNVPLGNESYIEFMSVIDREQALEHFYAKWYEAVLADANRDDRFMGWVIAVDSMDDLKAIASEMGMPIATTGGEGIPGQTMTGEPTWDRRRPSGETNGPNHAVPDDRHHGWPRGLPNFMVWPPESNHPDSVPEARAVRHRGRQPKGIAWVEVGDEALTREWLGPIGDQLDVRYVDGPAGLYAVGIRTDGEDIVIRREPAPLRLNVHYTP
jgi:hypothetical protein